ncbi:hypothetical protein GR925_31430 [Streptomyces sp. HUCO-GS316]|uniref:DUF6082 family protein n=1 Tax=Streptomyces sp. HUCO-GS316 TaxID=2692198 RepID=UPI00136CCF67|nr:DUF6082 family protein [Streptomyces sp. HUCO-GS316]MXM67825.1 hypothetical protein [Streptomyces sp. HUCO-GS316]
MTSPRRRLRITVVWSLTATATLAAISATPFLLNAVTPAGLNWDRLSSVSQTYSALSVLFSAAALLGVAASIAFQARQTHIQNEEAHRSSHRELTALTLTHPDFLTCWEPPNTPVTQKRWRQFLVSNLIVSMWSTDFRLNLLDEQGARAVAYDHFRGEVGRAYWANSGASWHRVSDGGSDRRLQLFVRILDEAYEASVASGPPVIAADYFVPQQPPRQPDSP